MPRSLQPGTEANQRGDCYGNYLHHSVAGEKLQQWLLPVSGGYAYNMREITSPLTQCNSKKTCYWRSNSRSFCLFTALWNISHGTSWYNHHAKKIITAYYHANTCFHLINIIRKLYFLRAQSYADNSFKCSIDATRYQNKPTLKVVAWSHAKCRRVSALRVW